MKHLRTVALALLVPAGLAVACKQITRPEASREASSGLHERSGFTLASTPAEGPVKGVPTWGTPFPLEGTETRVIPFARQEVRWLLGDKDHFAERGEEARARPGWTGAATFVVSEQLRWHNAVLQDMTTGEEWLLLEERGVVSRWWAQLQVAEERPSRVTALVFAVTTEDTNGDGTLDDRDGMRAIVTDPDGRSPRDVTPPATKLASVRIDGDTIFLNVRHDDDGDGDFEDREWSEPYVLGVGEEGPARPLVGRDVRARMLSTLN